MSLNLTIQANTSDGYIIKESSTWAGVKSGTSGDIAISNAVNYYESFSASLDSGTYRISRSFFKFDLSAINLPAGSVITSATIKLYGYAYSSSKNFAVCDSAWASPLSLDNFDAIGEFYGSSNIDYAPNQFNSCNFNSSGVGHIQSLIDSSGVLSIVVLDYFNDYLNIAPDGLYRSGCYYSDEGGSKRPELYIEFNVQGPIDADLNYDGAVRQIGSSWSTVQGASSGSSADGSAEVNSIAIGAAAHQSTSNVASDLVIKAVSNINCRITATDADWPTLRDSTSTGTVMEGDSELEFGPGKDGSVYRLNRIFFTFNINTIPITAKIIYAKFEVWSDGPSSLNSDLNLSKHNTVLTSNDWDTVTNNFWVMNSTTDQGVSLDYAEGGALSGLVQDAVTAGTGVVRINLRDFYYDDPGSSASAPGTYNPLTVFGPGYATSTMRPKLTIRYSTPDYEIARTVLSFDLSGLPTGLTVPSASLSLVKASGGASKIEIQEGTHSSISTSSYSEFTGDTIDTWDIGDQNGVRYYHQLSDSILLLINSAVSTGDLSLVLRESINDYNNEIPLGYNGLGIFYNEKSDSNSTIEAVETNSNFVSWNKYGDTYYNLEVLSSERFIIYENLSSAALIGTVDSVGKIIKYGSIFSSSDGNGGGGTEISPNILASADTSNHLYIYKITGTNTENIFSVLNYGQPDTIYGKNVVCVGDNKFLYYYRNETTLTYNSVVCTWTGTSITYGSIVEHTGTITGLIGLKSMAGSSAIGYDVSGSSNWRLIPISVSGTNIIFESGAEISGGQGLLGADIVALTSSQGVFTYTSASDSLIHALPFLVSGGNITIGNSITLSLGNSGNPRISRMSDTRAVISASNGSNSHVAVCDIVGNVISESAIKNNVFMGIGSGDGIACIGLSDSLFSTIRIADDDGIDYAHHMDGVTLSYIDPGNITDFSPKLTLNLELPSNRSDCENGGWYWYGGACHNNLPDTKTDCESYDYYWYLDDCHINLPDTNSECTAAGYFWLDGLCRLSKEIGVVPCICIDYVYNKWLIAGHEIDSVTSVFVGTSGSGIPIQRSGGFIIHKGYPYSNGLNGKISIIEFTENPPGTNDTVWVNCKGLRGPATLIVNPIDQIKNLLQVWLNKTDHDISLPHFSEARAIAEDRGYTTASIVDIGSGIKEIIESIAHSVGLSIFFTSEGKFAVKFLN